MPGMGNVYQFVQVHKDIEAYIDQLSNPWWSDAAKKLKVKIEDVSWPSDIEQIGIYVWKIQDSAWEGMGDKRPKFSLYNFLLSRMFYFQLYKEFNFLLNLIVLG